MKIEDLINKAGYSPASAHVPPRFYTLVASPQPGISTLNPDGPSQNADNPNIKVITTRKEVVLNLSRNTLAMQYDFLYTIVEASLAAKEGFINIEEDKDHVFVASLTREESPHLLVLHIS